MLPRSSVDREPGLIGLLLSLCEDYPVATWVLRQFPANAVRQFQLAFCLWIALALIRNLRAHTKFLTWFDGSGLQLARKRGLGAGQARNERLVKPRFVTASASNTAQASRLADPDLSNRQALRSRAPCHNEFEHSNAHRARLDRPALAGLRLARPT